VTVAQAPAWALTPSTGVSPVTRPSVPRGIARATPPAAASCGAATRWAFGAAARRRCRLCPATAGSCLPRQPHRMPLTAAAASRRRTAKSPSVAVTAPPPNWGVPGGWDGRPLLAVPAGRVVLRGPVRRPPVRTRHPKAAEASPASTARAIPPSLLRSSGAPVRGTCDRRGTPPGEPLPRAVQAPAVTRRRAPTAAKCLVIELRKATRRARRSRGAGNSLCQHCDPNRANARGGRS
jgi:hypothetical protein